jgi:hypothetical protein
MFFFGIFLTSGVIKKTPTGFFEKFIDFGARFSFFRHNLSRSLLSCFALKANSFG